MLYTLESNELVDLLRFSTGPENAVLFFVYRGTSGIDIDLRRVDIDQCPLPEGEKNLNIFAASDKCKKATTYVSISYYVPLNKHVDISEITFR